MTLFGTSALSALAVMVKVATSLFLSKVLAVYVGPSGYGLIGQFQSLISMVTTFASGATSNGVIKMTAEHAGQPAKQHVVWATAGAMGVAGAAVFALGLIGLREPLAGWLLGSSEYADVLVWLAAALLLMVAQSLLLAALNGMKAVRELAAANIVGSLVVAFTAATLVTTLGLRGALVALAIGPALACGFAVWMFLRVRPLRWRTMVGGFDPAVARSLGGYALMAATTAVVAPLGQMVIRDQLSAILGWESVGHWQALWKISEMHLLLLTSTLSVYFLPRFAEIRSGSELRLEVARGYRFVLSVVAVTSVLLFAAREPLIRGLLTESFLPLTEVLGLQLLGDALKIGSWVVAFTMVSHARTRAFVVTEVVFTVVYVVATVSMARWWGLAGTAVAYALTYLLYWLTVYWLYRGLVSDLRRTPSTVAPLGTAEPR